MRILFLGDIFGRSGRSAIKKQLPGIQKRWEVDFVVANCENATQGLGITPAHATELLSCGIDCMTLGDHAFDQKEIIGFLGRQPRILRPSNFARFAPGLGHNVIKAGNGCRVLVISVLGRVFMKQPFDDPVPHLQRALERFPLGRAVDAIVVDFHCEATSEKMTAGHWCDGSVTLVAGTHTHVPTADARILPEGTAYITDVGMCGDFDSVIGMDKRVILERFSGKIQPARMRPSSGVATICGVVVETDVRTGLAKSIEQLRIEGG